MNHETTTKESKIYWSDRNRLPPPTGAQFSYCPFIPRKIGPYLTPLSDLEHIKTLPAPIWNLKVMKRTLLPSKDEWIQHANQVLSKIDKVVLARCHVLELEQSPDPFQIAAALEKQGEGAFVFCLQQGDEAWIGASPERLFIRKGKQLIVEAMAGTKKRGKTLEEDRLQANRLLKSAKLQREIVPVQLFLQERLHPFCVEKPSFSDLIVHKTAHVQHLFSTSEIKLQDETCPDERIVQAIHPTPALSGTPQQRAIEWIERLEPFQRKLYGGVIGWHHENQSEWIVCIRCCYINKKTVHLFTGAGIVQGSKGASEWDELDAKETLFRKIFV